ncbi:MAG: bacillithiol biosynthesis deacetylase BshB1 [Saprospiraceae bacterium]|uniref:Bacillithiol biosynthesis deacetylase BshB1 n=1 Tax=Candidatus Opimibacter skivensis TaxID=2982028 RepID=A0A9D7XU55_9BACT|nr:bacillithiol biosynthesis deacetylase BshB1 [Candidatus Opimibacter skivensis]
MKIDLLFIAAHPDDVELCCAGTVFSHIAQGYTVGIVDLTAGELGTRGSAAIRAEEAANASSIMGISFRENLELKDGFFDFSESNKMTIIRSIRNHQPEIVITNAIRDRHPDHGRAAQLVSESCFLAGLPKIGVNISGQALAAWRPRHVYHMIQDRYISPDICVDITPYIDKKTEAVMAFKSQFYDPISPEPNTPISGLDFQEFLKARAREMGRLIGVEYAEGYTSDSPVRKNNLLD